MKIKVILTLIGLLGLSFEAGAQLISLKTVPLSTGDQFLIFPSQNLGMGGISIAMDDPYLNPFVNPAKATHVNGAIFYTSPTFYSVSDGFGSARTLPLGAILKSGNIFGGLHLTLQQIDVSNRTSGPALLGDQSSGNTYVFALFGKSYTDKNFAVGGSLYYADLNAVDGVDQMYDRSRAVDQDGYALDCRLGITNIKKTKGIVEALLLFNRYRMTHDVHYTDWLPTVGDFTEETGWLSRMEKNLDRSSTWGLHLRVVRPLSQSDWRIGGLLTGNWKSHPKLPNYEIMNIPRDPGTTKAYNVGLGVAKTSELGAFGIDFVYEPVWCNTWAHAAEPITTATGGVIRVGEKTIENDFTFSNAQCRIGFSRNGDVLGFQMGLEVKSYRYLLDQYDYVDAFRRKQREHWTEWTASLGLNLNFSDVHVQYILRIIMGTGQPGVQRSGWAGESVFDLGDFIPAPNGPLTLEGVTVFTHRVTVAIPLNP